MEGTEAVNTNHTNGSPFEDAARQSGQGSSDDLSSSDARDRNASSGDSLESSQSRALHGESATSVPDSHPEVEPSAVGGGDARHSVEGVSTIQELVHAMDNSGPDDVEEVIGMEPRDRDSIEFRVTCPGSLVRRLRLTGNRYTFGSAEGCSIRLIDETLRPMHAVLLRDASRIIVRAYSVPIQVNGTRTTEASLDLGDVLRLGQYQFELLSAKPVGMNVRGEAFSPSGTGFTSNDAAQEAASPEAFSRASKSGSESRSSRFSGTDAEGVTAEDMLWRDRLRREVDQWRERQIECDHREGRMDERESELRNRETELWSRAENLSRREARLQAQETSSFQLYDEFSQRQQELLALTEENSLREESFHAREVGLRDHESQYRSQLEEATCRLQQSQQAAESAVESVAQMREQFESLNTQIEQLSQQHLKNEAREQTQRAEHEHSRETLEEAPERAVHDIAASEDRQHSAEKLGAGWKGQVIRLPVTDGVSESEQLTRHSDSEAAAESLRQQVEGLQQMVAAARNEAEILRADYEQACSSVQQLETIVSESEGRGEEDRDQWIAETTELRSAVEKISSEMDQAKHELNQLREANDDLTRRLTEVQQERDQARQDTEARPSHEEVDSLRDQLESANELLGNMQLDHEQTMVRLEAAEQQNENVERVDDPSAHHADAVWEEVGNVTSEFPETESTQSIAQQKLESQKLESQNEAGQEQITTSHVSDADPANQETDAMQKHLENEKRFGGELQDGELQDGELQDGELQDGELQDGELQDGDQIVGGSPATELIQDLEAEDDLTVSRTVELNSSLDSFSNLASSGDEGDGLRFTECTRPETQDASKKADSSHEGFESVGESDDLAGVTMVGLHEADVDLDDHESKYANPQTDEFEQNLEVEAEITVSDEHEKKLPKLMECRAGGNELGEKHEPEGSESVADFKLFDSEDEGDTLEAYMTRLLKDVLGDVESTDVESTDAEYTDAEETNLDRENPTGVNAEEEEDSQPLDPNAPIVHRALASARDTDHSAMRELANTSARIAIQRVERLQSRKTQVKGMIRLVCALGAILSGAVCYLFLFGFPMYLSVAMSGVIAIVYVREAMQLFQEASCQFNAATSAVQDDGSAPASDEKSADEKSADEKSADEKSADE